MPGLLLLFFQQSYINLNKVEQIFHWKYLNCVTLKMYVYKCVFYCAVLKLRNISGCKLKNIIIFRNFLPSEIVLNPY